MSEANKEQVAGTHYQIQPFQHWDFVLEARIPYMEGQILKYMSRWRNKNGLQDLKKAGHFYCKLIEWVAEDKFYRGSRVVALSEDEVTALFMKWVEQNKFPSEDSLVMAFVTMWPFAPDPKKELARGLELLSELVAKEEIAREDHIYRLGLLEQEAVWKVCPQCSTPYIPVMGHECAGRNYVNQDQLL